MRSTRKPVKVPANRSPAGRQNQRVNCLIFDLSEVLIAGLLGVEKIIALRHGVDAATVLPHLGGERLARLCRGLCSEAEYLASVRSAAAWTMSSAELKDAIRENFRRPVEDMPELVKHLAGEYELVLLSDHGCEWIAYIESVHSFLQVFHRRIFSFQLGQTKDSIVTFRRVLDMLGKHPGECLFVDDNEGNITRARQAGIRSIRFSAAAALRQELRIAGLWGE
jgi:beta-phosphoglucomutase-like phosphatase (HAD superfamily)